jgi:hypothetical protein
MSDAFRRSFPVCNDLPPAMSALLTALAQAETSEERTEATLPLRNKLSNTANTQALLDAQIA